MNKLFLRSFVIVSFAAIFVMCGFFVGILKVPVAQAAAPNWNITGTWELKFNSTLWPSGNPYLHDMIVTGNTATGGTPAGGPYVNSWTANISISGDSVTINATYRHIQLL